MLLLLLSSLLLLISWLVHIFQCYYLIGTINNKICRGLMTIIPCMYLSYKSCFNLRPSEISSIVIVASCWFISIRLFGLIIFSKNKSIKLKEYLFKIFWIYFPIISMKESGKNEWSIQSYAILFIVKYLFNHFIYNSFSRCELENTYGKIVLFYMSIMTISFMYDLEIILVRLITKDRYTLQSFTNFPLFSLSLREFWGKRYNQLVNKILKESIYEPILNEYGYRKIAILLTFLLSGIYHIHIAYILLNDYQDLFPTFLFFVLNGIICSMKISFENRLPKLIRCLITNLFLLLTAPLVLQPFIKKGLPFLVVHPPPLSHFKWLPTLPSTDLCFL